MNYPKFILDRNRTQVFTVKQAAAYVGKHPKTIYRWIDEGILKNVTHIRGGYFISKEEIDRLVIIENP